MPSDVAADVAQRWPARGHEWADRVEQVLTELRARYGATPRTVLPARYGFVIAADTPHGGLVFRASHDPDAPTQAYVARALGDLYVSPAVHETIIVDTHTWTVMEEVRPGTPLPHIDPATVTIEALAEPLAAMVGQLAPVPGMPSIFDWLRERLADDELSDLALTSTIAPADERAATLRALEELARDATPGLCHADASTWNVLAHGDGGWRPVDPRGMSGEAAYDVATLGLKIGFRTGTSGIVARLARAASVDAERTQAWATVVDAARV